MNLPPLNALRAFEAAARHNSFAKAAEEMHVSAGAISRHVRILEEHLSLALFDRKAQGLGLTEVGRQLLPEITEAFRRIDTAAMRARITSNEIRVVAATTFAIRWLIPRLTEFQELYPGIRVSTGLCMDCEHFSEGAYDVGIVQTWWLDEIATDVETHFLRYERLTPVCSPAYAKRSPKLRKPSDLRDKVLLHTLDTKDWTAWLAAADERSVAIREEPIYSTGDAAARAALAGKGIAIVDIDLYKYELDSGQLVAPFDLVLEEASPIDFFCSKGRLAEPNICLFFDWLNATIRADG
jgi:LysR family transcriptional regulator, glycine cleavage system transcriptional activator